MTIPSRAIFEFESQSHSQILPSYATNVEVLVLIDSMHRGKYADPSDFEDFHRTPEDPSRRHAFDVIIRSHILILVVDATVKQYAST